MREPLNDVTLGEIVNSSYEAVKVVTASYLARLSSPDDALQVTRIFHAIAEEIDDARHDFIQAMRAQAPAEVEALPDDG